MRWELYNEQVHGQGRVALAVFVLNFGIFSWWALLQRVNVPFVARHRHQLVTAFWIVVLVLYLAFFLWLCFAWPE
jgi:hypothetical protein